MIGQIGSFEDIGEKGQSAVKNAAKSTQQGTANFVKTAAGQAGTSSQGDQGVNETNSTGGASQQMSDDDAQKFLQDLYGAKNSKGNQQANLGSSTSSSQKLQTPAKQQSVKAALGLTGSGQSQGKVPTPTETIRTALGIPESKPTNGPAPTVKETIKNAMGIPEIAVAEKTPEELAKIEALRSQLHGQYYQDLTNRKKPEEEHVTEKLEREVQEEKMTELETEKKKPPKLSVTVKQGTGENVVGVSG